MPSWEKVSRCYPDNPWFVRIFSVCITVTGCVAGANFLHIASLESYDIVSDMYEVQSKGASEEVGYLPPMSQSVRYTTVICIIASFAMALIGVMGFIGQMTHSSTRLCVYSVGSLILALIMAWRLIFAFTTVPLLDAVVDRQVTEWCLPANRLLYSRELGCAGGQHYLELEQEVGRECGPECKSRVAVLRDVGGCRFLNRICEDHSFGFVGKGMCLYESDTGSLVTAPYQKSVQPTTSSCCKLACDMIITCRGYSFETQKEVLNWHGGRELEGACSVVTSQQIPTGGVPGRRLGALGSMTGMVPQLTQVNPGMLAAKYSQEQDKEWEQTLKEMYTKCENPWDFREGSRGVKPSDPLTPVQLVGGDKRRQTACWQKGRPRVVEETLQGNMFTCVFASVNTALLLLAAITGFFYQYALATKRRGRKGLAFVLRQMLCPCISYNSNRTRKLVHGDGISDSESEGSFSSTSSASWT
ncbi:unnamed protein product [Effrenium voratum]|uniref:Uncharacterized protein n=1 Tax=Effrenium voratum TaxID=2562239 RepID=A0AA36MME4_9DINO|nr:unnamed protein product [Effrenium voratum]CAJ1430698.1 unnamed protein product [Effrenium voratum]